jgi:hypothetical protein
MINKNNNNIPYLRNKTSTLLAFSAIALLMLVSPLLHSNTLLLQPAQATTISLTSMQTQNPANLGRSCSAANATLTFEAKGNGHTLTNGTFQIADSNSGQILWSGGLSSASSQGGDDILLVYGVVGNVPVCGIGSGDVLQIQTDCGRNIIGLSTDDGDFREVAATVDCEPPPRDTTTAQQSSSSTPMTGTEQDSDGDGDGIPDSSDKCPHNSHHRCYKEGDTSTATTTTSTNQQQEQASSSIAGNQTR